MTTRNPINILQITDTHLYGTSVGTLLKMNTQHSLNQVIKIVGKHEKKIDLILATGDIAQDASDRAYENFISTIRAMNVPFRWIPGNHDNAASMRRRGRAPGRRG